MTVMSVSTEWTIGANLVDICGKVQVVLSLGISVPMVFVASDIR